MAANNQEVKSNTRLVWIILVFLLVALIAGGLFIPLTSSWAAANPDETRQDTPLLTHPMRKSNAPNLFSQPGEALQAVPDLIITKTHTADFVILEPSEYFINVKNIGTGTVSGTITVTDILTDVLWNPSVDTTGWDCTLGQTITCVYSNTAGVAPGATLPEISLTVVPTPTTVTQIINTAVVSNGNDGNPDNNSSDDLTTLVGADLQVTKTVAPTSPSEGGVITYTLTVGNRGPSDATGVILTDVLPTQLTFKEAQASPGTYTNTDGKWTIGNLANGANATLLLVATVNSGSLGTTIVNTTESLVSATPDYDPTNNIASVSFTVQSTQVTGRVTDAVTDNVLSGASVELRDSANRTYVMNTTATGWYTFTGTITNPIATGAALIRASRSGYASKTATPFLLPGQTTRQDFELDTVDLRFTKSDGLTTVTPGQTITYTMTISNFGTIPATGVVITDVLPTFLSFITHTLDVSPTTPAALTYVWKLEDNIAPNTALRFKLRVRVADALPSPATALTNQARVTTTAPEANTSNNIASDTTTSTGSPNPGITLSVSPNQVRTNQNATYTIKVTNTGTAPMTDIVVEDTFSTFLDLSTPKTSKGTATVNNSTRKVTVTFGVLNRNEEVTITVVGRVNTSATVNSTVTNTAKLTYKFGGSTFTRNSNTVSFQILAVSTLPGTGWVEISAAKPQIKPSLVAFISAGLLLILAMVAFTYAYQLRGQQSEWTSWAIKMGGLLSVAAVLFATSGWVLNRYTIDKDSNLLAQKSSVRAPLEKVRFLAQSEPETIVWPGMTPQIPGSELDQLPDFPIPTPTMLAPTEEAGADLSPVNRIIIPALALDTVVKYVPYDGLTWLIAGLNQEIAWMGDTSWPGLGGNTALAGHVTLRDGSNGPFRYLADLRYGDAIFVYTEKNIYEYMVSEQVNVEATDLAVLGASQESQITLITCSDWDMYTGFYSKRLVVKANLVGAKLVQQQTRGN